MDNWKFGFLDRQAFIANQCRYVAVRGFVPQQPRCGHQEQGNYMRRLITFGSSNRRQKASSAESFISTLTWRSMNEKCMEFCIRTREILDIHNSVGKMKSVAMVSNLCAQEQQMWMDPSQGPQLLESHMEGSEKTDRPHEPEDVFDSKVPETMGTNDVSESSQSAGQGTLRGAIGLITGTSVGAGILALPARTMAVGFVPTTITMGICWCFLVLEALIIAEINVALLKDSANKSSNRNSSVVSLCTMAEETLGPLGGLTSALIYCFLSYTVMVAYISRSGDLLAPLIHISPSSSCWIFTLLIGGLVFFGGTNLADVINQMLTAGLIGIFILIIMGGAAIANWSGLEFMDWDMTPQTFPVILFALVYHDLMPVLCTYLKGDIGRIRLAILLGSAIPLIMFVSWDAVIMCIGPTSRNEDPLAFLIRLGGTGISLMIDFFSILAVATSFIGTLLGFMEFFMERLSWASNNQQYRNNKAQMLQKLFGILSVVKSSIPEVFCIFSGSDSDGTCSKDYFPFPVDIDKRDGILLLSLHNWWTKNSLRIISFVLILAPPLAASIMVSDVFFSATDLAGGYGMTTLYGIFPPAMAWSLYNKDMAQRKDKSGLFFALPEAAVKAVLAGTGVCALGIILNQII